MAPSIRIRSPRSVRAVRADAPAADLSGSPCIEPGDWPRLFTERLNAGDIEGVVALYEADARFVIRSGETLAGREQIRPVLAGLIDAKTCMQSRVVQAVAAGDVAILYTDFQGTRVDASGGPIGMQHKEIEVL